MEIKKMDFMNIFPDELNVEILEHLVPRDLESCEKVCLNWQRISRDWFLWKHAAKRQESLLEKYKSFQDGCFFRKLNHWGEFGSFMDSVNNHFCVVFQDNSSLSHQFIQNQDKGIEMFQ